MKLHLHNMFPPVGNNGSALWGIHELPGVVLHRYPSTSENPGWRMERWDDYLGNQAETLLEKMKDQVFPTRREALQVIEMLMDMYPGAADWGA